MKFFRSIYINPRFYGVLVVNIFVFILGFFFPIFYITGKLVLMAITALLFIDILLLFRNNGLNASRIHPERLSNGDKNEIKIHAENKYKFPVHLTIIDEIPPQFQIRNFSIKEKLNSNEEKYYWYTLRPVKRGTYVFGKLNIYVSGMIGFTSRRYIYNSNIIVPVYPSYLQMKKYELLAISNRLTEYGVKKIRSIGRNAEFDQIRKYNTDDDYRTINWKATARKAELMVNQFQEEKSQHVYNVIDMGRVMKMPFEEMALLDYAINSSLVLSNIALYKHDKAGLITFTTKINTFLKADGKNNQINKILEYLYKQETGFAESNYELLYANIRRNISQRSLIILYTNFESIFSMQRQLSYLKLIAKQHVLIVVFFINTEIQKLLKNRTTTLEEIYVNTIAEKLLYEKKQIVKILKNNGIYTVLTEPKNLTVNTINKYLEIKATGGI